MSQPRRGATPQPQHYAAVPQSPQSTMNHQPAPRRVTRKPARTPSVNSQHKPTMQSGRGAIAAGVASGQIGAGYGPYSVRHFLGFRHSY